MTDSTYEDVTEGRPVNPVRDYIQRSQERSRIGFDKVHAEFGKLWSKFVDKSGYALNRNSLRHWFREGSNRILTSKSTNTRPRNFQSHIGDIDESPSGTISLTNRNYLDSEEVPEIKSQKDDLYTELDFEREFDRNKNSPSPGTEVLTDQHCHSRKLSYSNVDRDRNGWPVPKSKTSICKTDTKEGTDTTGNERMQLDDCGNVTEQRSDYVNVTGKVDAIVHDAECLDLDESVFVEKDERNDSGINDEDGYLVMDRKPLLEQQYRKRLDTYPGTNPVLTRVLQPPTRCKEDAHKNDSPNENRYVNVPSPISKFSDTFNKLSCQTNARKEEISESNHSNLRTSATVTCVQKTKKGNYMTESCNTGSRLTMRKTVNEERSLHFRIGNNNLNTTIPDKREVFFAMTVEEVVECFNACALSSLAAVCHSEFLDGEYFRAANKDSLMQEPFNLTEFHIGKLNRIISGWRPKHSSIG